MRIKDSNALNLLEAKKVIERLAITIASSTSVVNFNDSVINVNEAIVNR